jgi:hypothetical protein
VLWDGHDPNDLLDDLLVALAGELYEGGRFPLSSVIQFLRKARGDAQDARALVWIEARIVEWVVQSNSGGNKPAQEKPVESSQQPNFRA